MFTLQTLDALIQERLDGDRSRLPELFNTREVFDLLKASSKSSDWFHFEPKTFDGEYLIETPTGYQTYQQDRGTKSGAREFRSLREAAEKMFS